MNNSIIVYGMRRSGLHCVCLDIIKSSKLNHTDVEFVNDSDYKSYQSTSSANKMFLFEDKFYTNKEELNNKKTIIITRDIYDNIISRSKVHQASKAGWWAEINHNYISTYINILKEILGYTDFYMNKTIISYDLYINPKTDYRKNILASDFKYVIVDENMSKEIPHYGGGKSFKEDESRKDVRITEDVINRLNNQVFLNLVQEYFHYDLLDKLKDHVI